MLIFGQPRDSLPNKSQDSPAPVTQMGLQDPLPGTQVDPARFPNENRHLRSPLTAFEATIKVEDAFTSRLNTLTSRPPDDGALSPDVVEDSDDGQPLSPLNEESLEAANRTPYHPGPGLDTSDPIHDQATNKTNQLDGIVIEEQHTPSLPSPSASSTGTREHSQNAPKPGVQIQYFIIKARTPRLAYTRWPEGTLRDKTLGSIFDEVASYTSKTKIRKFWFKLDTSRAEIEYPIRRGDENTLDDMKRDFDDEEMRVGKKDGNTTFKIWLEPDPTEQESTGAGLVEGSESKNGTIRQRGAEWRKVCLDGVSPASS